MEQPRPFYSGTGPSSTGLWDGHIVGKMPEMRGLPIDFPFTSNENWLQFWAGLAEDQISSVYGLCGAFGICHREIRLNHCKCLSGCSRKKKLGCESDQFALKTGMTDEASFQSQFCKIAESTEGCRSA
ncbi:hypothetical protein EJ110_NYTH32419 [Nymphaea thermarum]|nr:hypothetical protein EJ110_NYTH32419 [Nymphaea thermarum]